jgi:hypothetical protein
VDRHKPLADGSLITQKVFGNGSRSFPFSQDIPADKVIKSDDLMAQLMAEAPAILAWAVQGCRDYLEVNGLDVPPEVIPERSIEFRREQDSIGQFLEERCETLIEARPGLRTNITIRCITAFRTRTSTGPIKSSATTTANIRDRTESCRRA